MTDDERLANHPDRYALEYLDMKIAQHKLRGHDVRLMEKVRLDHYAAALALSIVRGDIFALLHRPSPVIEPCTHPIDKQVDDMLPNIGLTIRCKLCGEHRPRKVD